MTGFRIRRSDFGSSSRLKIGVQIRRKEDKGGKWATNADGLLKFLSSKELSVCWI